MEYSIAYQIEQCLKKLRDLEKIKNDKEDKKDE